MLVLLDSFELHAEALLFLGEVLRHFKERSVYSLHIIHTLLFPKMFLIFKGALFDLCHLGSIKPLNPFSFLPQAALLSLIGHRVRTQSMLFSTGPEALVAAAVAPRVHAKAVLLIILILPLINPSISPRIHATAMHVVIQPFSLILTAVEPRVHTKALYFVLVPFAVIPGAVIPAVLAPAVFLTGKVRSLIHTPIGPALPALSVLEVVGPAAFVACAVHMCVNALAIGFVVHPVSLVHITIDMRELPISMGPIILPITLVEGTIRPRLPPISVSEASFPLAIIGGSGSGELERGSFLPPSIRIVPPIPRQRLPLLSHRKVPRISMLGLPNHIDLFTGLVSTPERLQLHNQVSFVLERIDVVARLEKQIISNKEFTYCIMSLFIAVLVSLAVHGIDSGSLLG